MSAKAGGALRKKLADNLRDVDSQLANDPHSFGEIYRSKGAIAEYLGIYDILSFDVAVDERHRLVVVRKCQALTGHGLE
jgi:hypothetical protein